MSGFVRVDASGIFSDGLAYGVEVPPETTVEEAIKAAALVLELPDPGELEVRADSAILSEDSKLLGGSFQLAYQDDRKLATS